MAKKNEEVASPEFRVGEQVFDVLSGGQKLTVKKVLTSKNGGNMAYIVAPQKGEPFRATEGELQLTSPYATKVRVRQFNDYDNENEDFGDSPMGQTNDD